MGVWGMLLWGSAGFVGAHLLESAWHRWIAHGKRPDPTRTTHLEHHRLAAELVDVVAEIRENAWRSAKTVLVTSVVLSVVMGLSRALPLTAGLVIGLIAVNFEHATMHRRGPRWAWERWMWRFHWHHHAADARVNFGLTNPILDFAFGTAFVPKEVELHPRLAPAWLRNAGGEVAGIRVRAG